MLLVRGCQGHHSIAMDKGSDGLFLFVRRNVCGHEKYLPQLKTFHRRLCQGEMSSMDGVETATEKSDVHW